MSGYRTPYYNRSIGNETRYSRHVYGDAADIYVDDDDDGIMDDLDGDGKSTLDDARTLGEVIGSLSGEELVSAVRGRARPLQGQPGAWAVRACGCAGASSEMGSVICFPVRCFLALLCDPHPEVLTGLPGLPPGTRGLIARIKVGGR